MPCPHHGKATVLKVASVVQRLVLTKTLPGKNMSLSFWLGVTAPQESHGWDLGQRHMPSW